jgi:hypothetical protein
MTSHELNAGYEPAWSPSARSAVRRQTIKTARNVGGKELSIFSILWALMILLGLNYIHCVAYTTQGFLDSYATWLGKLVDPLLGLGNSYHCVFVYTRHRATDNSTVLWALPGRVVAFPHDLPYTVDYATATNTIHSRKVITCINFTNLIENLLNILHHKATNAWLKRKIT